MANRAFEVRFSNANIKTYVKASVGGVSIGGWNQTASFSGPIRISFVVNFSPPSTIVLTDLKLLGVNFENTPNWLDDSLIKDALNAIFPDSIAISQGRRDRLVMFTACRSGVRGPRPGAACCVSMHCQRSSVDLNEVRSNAPNRVRSRVE